MPLDALCLSGLVRELDQTVTGGKIDKIYQPGRDEVILALRTPAQGNVRLLLSANPSHPRPQLTQLTRENPDTPPMFCMLLRKHLSGARILSVAQPPLERVVTLTLEAMNELGDRVERRLVLEAIGRRSNLILLDEEGRILDCIRRVESSLGTGSAQRALLPGMFYRLPPPQAKLDPMAQDRAALEALLSAAPEEAQADQWLLDTFGGLSPRSAGNWPSRPEEPWIYGSISWVPRAVNGFWTGWSACWTLSARAASPPASSPGTGPPPTSPSSRWSSMRAGWSAPPSPPSPPCWTAFMRNGSTWSGSSSGDRI